MRLLALAAALALAASGCALRPQYRNYVKAVDGQPVKLMVLERLADKPMAGAKVELGEGKSRVSATTQADGLVTLPSEKRLFDDNAIIVVTVPEGRDGYRLIVASEFKRRCGSDAECAAGEVCESTVCAPKKAEPAPAPAEATTPAAAPAPEAATPAPAK